MKKMRVIRLLMLISIITILGACSDSKLRDSLDWDVEKFTFTDQHGKKFGSSDLKEKVWVADFIFTSCQTVCPPMTANMAKLQKMLNAEGIKDVEFVSFSVDPEVDTPEKITEFMKVYEMDTKRTHFLTGYTRPDIERFAKKNFQTLVTKPENNSQVIHGTSFYLVDKDGKVVKKYSGLQNTPYEDIIRDIKRIR
ncbi:MULTISPECIES: SCO family protein [Bacillus cereus group]|uniref:SCO family protein n=1 Tax=Bacillus cereus group TaxID=86661 RepID=UPI0001A0C49B|nr:MULTISPECIES: SCO family protein [Bacillus cereus group]EEL33788.1 Cytochrome c oxidase Cu(A) center assembly protein [Bacillus cereus Rock3-28]MBJ7944569.1 SCO family protein [Bacillus cereus group sp. N24]OSM13280.1 cytochrome c oxidase assembly protein [Bacillus toyonensis]UFH95691.1 SCO family protein [Bacillus toyonensis]UKS58280.1 SCO family protein [Bacillus toyonensis]